MTSTREVVARSPLPEHEATRLLSAVTGLDRVEILLGADVAPDEVAAFALLERKRLDDVPLQYLEGSVPFGGATVAVDPRVLVPRPETEELLALALRSAAEPRIVVDLCTGSGNLAIGLALALPGAVVHATELSEAAVEVARANVQSNDVDVQVHRGDLFDPLPESLKGNVDLLVANPPYLAASEFTSLPADVRQEPRMALVAGERGDEVIASIATHAQRWLRPGAPVICEISEYQGVVVRDLFRRYGGRIERDVAGKDRFVIGRCPVE